MIEKHTVNYAEAKASLEQLRCEIETVNASAAMDHALRMNRIRGYQYLKLLRLELREIVRARFGPKAPVNNLEEVVESR